MKYKRNPGPWRFMSLGKKFFLLAALFFAISCIAFLMKTLSSTWIAIIMPQVVWSILGEAEYISMGCGIALLIAGILSLMFPKARRILWLVKRSLFDPSRGNPLHLKEGQYLPSIRCKEDNEEQERFILKIQSKGFQPEQIKDLAPVISPALTGRLKNYAVTSIHEDEAHNFIDFVIEDVTADFPIYKELGRLLTEYYSESGPSGEAEREPPDRPAAGAAD